VFAVTILAIGLILRGLVQERAKKKETEAALAVTMPKPHLAPLNLPTAIASGPPLLCAVRGIGRTLDFAIEEAKETNRPLYLLFVREQPVITAEDRKRKWQEDEEAYRIFEYASEKADGHTVLPCYAVSDSPAETIADIAATVGASRLILGAPQRNRLVNLLRGNMIRKVSDILPEEIHMLVYA
jgi:nucleotide-binding universal stress UspA family protein